MEDRTMDKGTTVYRAYTSSDDRFYAWVTQGTVTDIVADSIPLVQVGSNGTSLSKLDETWREREIEAKRDIHREMIKSIGKMQAKADALADEILHDALTTEEVNRGVA